MDNEISIPPSIREALPHVTSGSVLGKLDHRLTNEIDEQINHALEVPSTHLDKRPVAVMTHETDHIQVDGKEVVPQGAVVYLGGIAFHGLNKSEATNTARSEPQKAVVFPAESLAHAVTNAVISLSPEKKEEDLTAIEFLQGYKYVAAPLAPVGKEYESSLRMDMIALRESLKVLQKDGFRSDIAAWSNGGFKMTSVLEGARVALSEAYFYAKQNGIDITAATPEKWLPLVKEYQHNRGRLKDPRRASYNQLLDIFTDGSEAYAFLELLNGANIYMGGAPLNERQLSTPVEASWGQSRDAQAKEAARQIVDKAIGGVAKLEDHQAGVSFSKVVPMDNIKKMASRLLEMGRGPDTDTFRIYDEWNKPEMEFIRNMMRDAVGDLRVAVVMDRSGSVVDASDPALLTYLTKVFGNDLVWGFQTKNVAFKDPQTGEHTPSKEAHLMLKNFFRISN
jgi:hypothetical protein